MATPSSTLAWKIPWTEEPGRLQSTGSLGVGHDWATSLSLFPFMHWRRKWQATWVFFLGASQGRGSLMGCRLWGRTELGTTEATLPQQQWLSVSDSVNPCPVAYQAPLSMGSSQLEHSSGMPFFFFPEYLPNPGIKPTSPTWQLDSLLWATWESQILEETRIWKQRKLMWRNMIKL